MIRYKSIKGEGEFTSPLCHAPYYLRQYVAFVAIDVGANPGESGECPPYDLLPLTNLIIMHTCTTQSYSAVRMFPSGLCMKNAYGYTYTWKGNRTIK